MMVGKLFYTNFHPMQGLTSTQARELMCGVVYAQERIRREIIGAMKEM